MGESKSIHYQLISYYILWLPAAAVSLVLKFVMLHSTGDLAKTGISATARALNRTVTDESTKLFPGVFTFWEMVSFYREDYVLVTLIIPTALFSLVLLLPAKARLWIVASTSTLYSVFLMGQIHVYLDLGGFVSIERLQDGIRWVAGHPEDFENYVAPHVYRIAYMVAFLAMLSLVLPSQAIYRRWIGLPLTGQRILLYFPALTLCGVGLVAWMVDMPSTSMHASAPRYIMRALLPDLGRFSRFDRLGPEKLQDEYREFVLAPDPSKDSEYWAAAQSYNIIYFVLETIPHRLLDLGADLQDVPNLRRLREESWVALNHYSTSALSNRALFSLLSSVYRPPVGRVVDAPNRRVKGLVPSLKNEGYETVFYLPETLVYPWEQWMFEALGFSHLDVPQEVAPAPPQGVERWKMRKWFDAYALNALSDDIKRWAQQDRRFLAAFAPQIGHAPWPDIHDDGVERGLWVRGRDVVVLEDQLIGQLMSTLEEVGLLDRTLIVFTADHGIRHWQEDPQFPAGRPGDDSFHVPLMIYAPGVLTSPHEITWATSHIDVAPTLATLLGINEGREMEQGAQIWDPALRDRTVYFWAHLLDQVRGYSGPGHFALWNGLLDVVYVNAGPQFDPSTRVPRASALHESVSTNIRTFEDLQRAWVRAAIR